MTVSEASAVYSLISPGWQGNATPETLCHFLVFNILSPKGRSHRADLCLAIIAICHILTERGKALQIKMCHLMLCWVRTRSQVPGLASPQGGVGTCEGPAGLWNLPACEGEKQFANRLQAVVLHGSILTRKKCKYAYEHIDKMAKGAHQNSDDCYLCIGFRIFFFFIYVFWFFYKVYELLRWFKRSPSSQRNKGLRSDKLSVQCDFFLHTHSTTHSLHWAQEAGCPCGHCHTAKVTSIKVMFTDVRFCGAAVLAVKTCCVWGQSGSQRWKTQGFRWGTPHSQELVGGLSVKVVHLKNPC